MRRSTRTGQPTIASLMPSKTEPGTPFGLFVVCSRNGGITPSSIALRDPGRPVRREVAGHLAGAHRETGKDDILVEREMVQQRLQIAANVS